MFTTRYLVLFLILFGSVSSWATDLSFRKIIEQDLPQELTELSPKMTKKDLIKKFQNKISSSDNEALFMSYFKNPNDVTIGLAKGHFDYILITPPSDQIKESELFKKVISSLSNEEKKTLKNSMIKNTHEDGRYITIKLPREHMSLKFINNEEKTLVSILLRPKGKTRP